MLKRNQDKEIIETFASNEAMTLIPMTCDELNPRLSEDERVFTYERYAEEIHPPIEVFGKLELTELPRCLDMPIRLAGEEAYQLPKEWSSLAPTLERIIGVEHAHNPHWRDYFTYITVDCKPMSLGEQQRHGGLHVDGFQGSRIEEKTKITRNYVATTNGGTQFWPMPFVVADPEKFNVFEGFDLQAEGSPFVAKADTVYFMDAYTVHESGYAEFEGNRIFLRVTYDLKRFDRKGNTHNPNLSYDWPMVKRNAQELVATPRTSDLLASPYFPNLTLF